MIGRLNEKGLDVKTSKNTAAAPENTVQFKLGSDHRLNIAEAKI